MIRHEHVSSSSFYNMISSQAENNSGWNTSHTIADARFWFNTFSTFYLDIFQSSASILWHMRLQLWCQTLLSILLRFTTHQFASNNCTQQKHVFFSYFFSVELRNLGHCEKECQTRNSPGSSSKLYTYLLSCQVHRRFCQRVLFSVKRVWEREHLSHNKEWRWIIGISSFKNHALLVVTVSIPRCERLIFWKLLGG